MLTFYQALNLIFSGMTLMAITFGTVAAIVAINKK